MNDKSKYKIIPMNNIFKNAMKIKQVSNPSKGRLIQDQAQKVNTTEQYNRHWLVLIIKRLFTIKITHFGAMILSFLLLLNHNAFAKSSVKLPTGICSGASYECDTKTLVRWMQFQNSVGIDLKPVNFLSVGSCSLNGNSKSNINVLLALSKNRDNVYFDAKISFHDDLGRYKNTPASQIENVFPTIYQNRNLLATTKSHAYIDYTEITPYRYWVRHDLQSNKLFLLAYFGFTSTFLCEFDNLAV